MAYLMNKICDLCGSEFTGRGRQRFCSTVCSAKSQRVPRIKGACKNCGVSLIYTEARPLVYCSDECLQEDKGYNKPTKQYEPEKYPNIRRVISTASSNICKGDTSWQRLHQRLTESLLAYS